MDEILGKFNLKKIKSITVFALIILFLIDLTYRNTSWQEFLKYLTLSISFECIYFKLGNIFLYLKTIVKIIFLSILALYLLYVVGKTLIIKFLLKKKIRKKVYGKSYLNEKLAYYLEKTNKKTFVIDGEWGSGKTYALRRFTNEYFKYDKQKPIYISCFGISTREQIEKLIKNSYEKNDETMKSKFNLLIKSIPILGETLHNIFKPKYDFKYMKKSSLFIFDDFERIAECYTNNTFNNKNEDATNNTNEDINNNSSNSKLSSETFNKFNITSGVINELTEIYKIKVIIVCDNTKINTKLFNEIIHNKLSAIVYKFELENSEDKIESLLSNTLENIIIDKDKYDILKKFIDQQKDYIICIWQYCKLKNLRYLQNILVSFIDAISYSNLNLTQNILEDLFYSIFLEHMYYVASFDPKVDKKLFNRDVGLRLYDSFKKLSQLKETEDIFSFKYKEIKMDFVKKYAYVGQTVSSYEYSVLKKDMIFKELEYFNKLKNNLLKLKYDNGEINTNNLPDILNSLEYFRLEDLIYCLNKLQIFKIDKELAEKILYLLLCGQCIIDTERKIDFNDLIKPLESSNIIYDDLIENYTLLERICEKFFNKISNLNQLINAGQNLIEIYYEQKSKDDSFKFFNVSFYQWFTIFAYCKNKENEDFKHYYDLFYPLVK